MKKMVGIKIFLSIALCVPTLQAAAPASSPGRGRVTFAEGPDLERPRTIDPDARVTASV